MEKEAGEMGDAMARESGILEASQAASPAAVPEKEPARQYYFIERCREYAQGFARRQGHAPYFIVNVIGCQMSARDGEKLAGILSACGCIPVEEEKQADIILFTTCTVRENANQRLYGRIGRLKHQAERHEGLLIGITGCMMQERDEVETIQKRYPYVKLIFGTHNVYKLAELLYGVIQQEGRERMVEILSDTDRIVEDLPSSRKYPFKASVNISYGCNNFCSYCIVPYVRGREKSRQAADILRECKALLSDGVKEITLLGQNVNSYGKDLEGAYSFPELLAAVADLPGLRRLRFMTPNPKDFSDTLIETILSHPNIERHIHLPLQSGSTEILRRMNRKYTKEDYLRLAHTIRAELPEASLTTDIIVGFPGETEEDFQETLAVVREAVFDAAFTFIYSRREGTPAAKWDLVPEELVKERFARLLALLRECAAEREGRDTGKIMEVLVEERDREREGFLTGRLSNNALVHFAGMDTLVGEMIPVRLEQSMGFYYYGSVVK